MPEERPAPAARRGYSDQPTSVDALGMAQKYNGLARFICECETPMTIAINGDWGSGKSSAMKIIQQSLKDRKGPAVQDQIIEFNTWEFSIVNDDSKLVFELLRALDEKLTALEQKHQLEPDKNDGQLLSALTVAGDALKNFTVRLINDSVVGQGAAAVKDALTGKIQSQPGPESIVYTSPTRLLRTVSESISARIRAVVGRLRQEGDESPRIFIFVDDLDRLDPRVALELIEGMKNFADYENCVFILAVDQKVVERGLKSKYGDEFSDGMAQHFFDKIIQLPFVLPVNSYRLGEYVAQLLQGGALPAAGQADGEMARRYAAMLRRFGICNPRTIKRSFNMLHMYQCMNEGGEAEAGLDPAGCYRQYAVLLLLLTSEEDHARMAQLVDGGCSYETDAELLQIEAEFKALRTAPDEESGGCSEYIAAVLDAFYGPPLPAEGQSGQPANAPADPVATKALIDALAFTRSEEVDRGSYASARFAFELFQRLEAAPENAVVRASAALRRLREQTPTIYALARSAEPLRIELDPLAGGAKLLFTRSPASASPAKRCFLSLYSTALSEGLLAEIGGFHILANGEAPDAQNPDAIDCYWSKKENERSRATLFITEANAKNAHKVFALLARCGCFGRQG